MLLAGGLGFEPRLAESESAVLPLDDPPIKGLFCWQVFRPLRSSGQPFVQRLLPHQASSAVVVSDATTLSWDIMLACRSWIGPHPAVIGVPTAISAQAPTRSQCRLWAPFALGAKTVRSSLKTAPASRIRWQKPCPMAKSRPQSAISAKRNLRMLTAEQRPEPARSIGHRKARLEWSPTRGVHICANDIHLDSGAEGITHFLHDEQTRKYLPSTNENNTGPAPSPVHLQGILACS